MNATQPVMNDFACAEDYYAALNEYYANQVDVAEWGDLAAAA